MHTLWKTALIVAAGGGLILLLARKLIGRKVGPLRHAPKTIDAKSGTTLARTTDVSGAVPLSEPESSAR